jgi:glycerol-3-phosphate dehydrogenase
MIGGKLASYRLFAEEATDLVARRLGVNKPGTAHVSPLPGGETQVDPLTLAMNYGVDPTVATRLEYRHGSRADRILDRVRANPREAAVVCPCEPVTEAEIRHVVENEWAQSVDDVSRRTRLGLGSCGGMRCAGRCGAIVAEMTDRSPAVGLRLALEFLEQAGRRRAPAVGPEQARQEALGLAAARSALGQREKELV